MITNEKVSIPDIIFASKKFDEIRQKIYAATCELNPVEIVTPLNYKESRESWIELAKNGIFENPIFQYNDYLLSQASAKKSELESLYTELTDSSIKPDESDIAAYFIWKQLHDALLDAITTTLIAESIREKNDKSTAMLVQKKYGLPDQIAVKNALEVVLENQAEDSLTRKAKKQVIFSEEDESTMKRRKLHSQEIRHIFDWAMNQYHTAAWPIQISSVCSAIDVRDKTSFGHSLIVIPEDKEVSGIRLAELVNHEIDCHWRSSLNAQHIGVLKCDDELVYEGLAMIKDRQFSINYNGTISMNPVYYIIAENEALHGHTFDEVGKLIYDYLPHSLENREAKAWLYTYRTFRGATDTTNPDGYAFTKDRAYFEGFLYATELMRNGLGNYLNYSTLSKNALEHLIRITDSSTILESVISDRNTGDSAIHQILGYMNRHYSSISSFFTN